jgi:hypothetical protein
VEVSSGTAWFAAASLTFLSLLSCLASYNMSSLGKRLVVHRTISMLLKYF